MRASILTYHSGNMAGNDYSSNNLLALAHDLDVVRALRLLVVPLRLVAALLDRTVPLPEGVVASIGDRLRPRADPGCRDLASGG